MTDVDRLVLPSDSLVILVGAAGCGKSTFARRRFLETQVVSSDRCRALVSDDEADRRASRDAFALMYFIVDKRLKRGRLTVADATNVHAEKRESLLVIARRRHRPAVALVFALPYELCLERNRHRAGRRVPPAAVGGQHALLRESMERLEGEGFAVVHVLRSDRAVASLALVVEGDARAPQAGR